MFWVALPAELAASVEKLLYHCDPVALKESVRRLKERYVEGRAPLGAGSMSQVDALAYAGYRLPATYGALEGVLGAVQDVAMELSPQTLLDVGAGPGTGIWAFTEWFSSIRRVTALEREPAMRRLGQALLGRALNPVLQEVDWRPEDLMRVSLTPHQVVLASYVVGELPEQDVVRVANKLWRAAESLLVVVEPGTPGGFGRIRQVRDTLLAQGAHIIAPCPHDHACPMQGGDWCHFSQRVARSRRHKQLKGAVAPFEDEKYSYVALTRAPVAERRSRILRHPQVETGKVRLRLCEVEGLTEVVVSQRQGDSFRRARKAQWGGSWEP